MKQIYKGPEKGLYEYEEFWKFMAELGSPFCAEPIYYATRIMPFQIWHFVSDNTVVRYTKTKELIGGPILVHLSGTSDSISKLEKSIMEAAGNEN